MGWWRCVAGRTAPADGRMWVYVILAASLALAGGGCLRPAPPKLNLPEPAPPAAAMDLTPYIQAARYGEWVYERVELRSDNEGETTRYARRVTAERMSEGFLERRAMPPLEQYIQPRDSHSPASRPADDTLPPLDPREAPQLFELDEPMEPVPPELVRTNPVVTSSELRYYDRRGRLDATGTITRRVHLEGAQDVDCPAGHFAGCLRLRIELRIEFPFGPIIDWNSYVWLSREAGEVRRIEEFSGVFWIFGFGSAHEFRLVSYSRQTPTTGPTALPPRWVRGLVLLDRPIPRPRISGIMVDFATSQPSD